ncbi:MAG: SDR family NAD(P)-dependent oxidoreductase [bacterium]|nr:SDR family NAD(P)-dependent oxidoreductase [bacterium]
MKDQAVLITGGTKGIGLASALEFAQAGARLYLTYKWGSADTKDLYRRFEEKKCVKPVLLEADVSLDEDTYKLLAEIAKHEKKIDIFISNVAFAQRTMSLDEYKKRSLFKTLEYSTWPMIEYTRKIKKQFGKYPKYILGISSDGPDHFYRGYDFVAASKALLEFFARYLSIHLFDEGCRVNVVRFGTVKTESFSQIFGQEFFDYIKQNGVPDEMVLQPEDCAKVVFGLCSGFMDAVNGQIITADFGMTFQDNLMMRYLSSKNKKS